MQFNLRDDAITQYTNIAIELFEDLQSETRIFFTDISNIANRTGYDRLQHLVYRLLTDYRDNIISSIIKTRVFNNWEDSDVSLLHYMQKYNIGEEAEQTCISVQNTVKSKLFEIWKNEIPEMGRSSNPYLTINDFKEIKSTLPRFINALEEIKNDYSRRFNRIIEENEIFISLDTLAHAIIYEAISPLHEMHSKVNELEEWVLSQNTKQISDSEINTQSVVNTAEQQVAEQTHNLLDNIFGDYSDFPNESGNAGNMRKDDSDMSVDNINKIIKVFLDIINTVGIDKVNGLVDKYYNILEEGYNIKSDNSKKEKSSKSTNNRKNSGKYGRYIVTEDTIDIMKRELQSNAGVVSYINSYYERVYTDIEDKKGFKTVRNLLQKLTDVTSAIGLGNWDFSKSTEENTNVTVQMSGITASMLMFGDAAVGVVAGSAAIGVLNSIMQKIEEDKLLTNVTHKFWNLLGKNISRPNINYYIENYVIEKHEIEKGEILIEESLYRPFHTCIKDIDDKNLKVYFEQALFVGEYVVESRIKTTSSELETMQNLLGAGLNMVRSGVIDEEIIEPEKANNYLDNLYTYYVGVSRIEPNIKCNPLSLLV